MEGRRRYTRSIEVGIYEDKVGYSLCYDTGEREHFLFSREVARDLALKLLHVIDRTPTSMPSDRVNLSDFGGIGITGPTEEG